MKDSDSAAKKKKRPNRGLLSVLFRLRLKIVLVCFFFLVILSLNINAVFMFQYSDNVIKNVDYVLLRIGENGSLTFPEGIPIVPPEEPLYDSPLDDHLEEVSKHQEEYMALFNSVLFHLQPKDDEGVSISSTEGSLLGVDLELLKDHIESDYLFDYQSFFYYERIDGNPYRCYYSSRPDRTLLIIRDITNELYIIRSYCFELIIFTVILILATIFIFILVSFIITKPVQKTFLLQKQFIGDASHELKTPLSVIMSSTDIIKSHPTETVAQNQHWLETIEHQEFVMKDLITDLLFLSHSEDGSFKKTFTDLNLSSLITEEALTFEAMVYESGKNFSMNVQPDLMVRGDEASLRRIAPCLLDNACKYSNEGAEIRLSLTKVRKMVCLSVFNTGSFLSQKEIQNIFTRFYRTDLSHSKSGFGLGLPILKRIVEEHKGRVQVQSTSEKGTEFLVYLPLIKSSKKK